MNTVNRSANLKDRVPEFDLVFSAKHELMQEMKILPPYQCSNVEALVLARRGPNLAHERALAVLIFQTAPTLRVHSLNRRIG